MQAGARRDPELEGEPIGHARGVLPRDVERHHPGVVVPIGSAEDPEPVQPPHPLDEPRPQRRLVRGDAVDARLGDEPERRRQAREALRVHGPRLQMLRVRIRLEGVGAPHARPAVHERRHVDSRSHREPAGALRAHEALVAREADDVRADGAHVDRPHPQRLRGVQHEQGAACVRRVREGAGIGDGAGEVGRVRRHHGARVRAEQAFELLHA